MSEQKMYINEAEEVISIDELKDHFENGMEDWERAEYNNCFDDYLVCCMWWNGGTLSPYHMK